MSVSTTPPPAQKKKSGLGCLGCGCLVLALLVILFVGLVAGGCYFGYHKILSLTSTTPAEIPSFNGSDDVYNAAAQKITAFQHDVQNRQAATIQLSADEINTLIARDPQITRQQVRLFVTLTNDQAQVQGSFPTDTMSQGMLPHRYFNFDTTFGLGFNSDTKSIELMLHRMQIGDQTAPQNLLPTVQAELTPTLNALLQKNPDMKTLLQQAKSIQVKDGELVIETGESAVIPTTVVSPKNDFEVGSGWGRAQGMEDYTKGNQKQTSDEINASARSLLNSLQDFKGDHQQFIAGYEYGYKSGWEDEKNKK